MTSLTRSILGCSLRAGALHTSLNHPVAASQVTLAFILGLPMIHSVTAFSAVVSISTIGLYISCGLRNGCALKGWHARKMLACSLVAQPTCLHPGRHSWAIC